MWSQPFYSANQAEAISSCSRMNRSRGLIELPTRSDFERGELQGFQEVLPLRTVKTESDGMDRYWTATTILKPHVSADFVCVHRSSK